MPKKAMEVLTESMFYVLMAFCSGPLCGIDAADFIERRTGGRVQMGPAKLLSCITEKGRQAYQAELARLRQCVADAEGCASLWEGSK